MRNVADDTRSSDEGKIGSGIDALLGRFVDRGSATSVGDRTIPASERALAAADACVYGLANCTALRLSMLLWFVFLLALWLVFPVASAALLRRAQQFATDQEKGEIHDPMDSQ